MTRSLWCDPRVINLFYFLCSLQLKITFDDQATNTFEYPSEVSLLEEVDMAEDDDHQNVTSDRTSSETNNNLKSPGGHHHQLGQPSNLALRSVASNGTYCVLIYLACLMDVLMYQTDNALSWSSTKKTIDCWMRSL